MFVAIFICGLQQHLVTFMFVIMLRDVSNCNFGGSSAKSR